MAVQRILQTAHSEPVMNHYDDEDSDDQYRCRCRVRAFQRAVIVFTIVLCPSSLLKLSSFNKILVRRVFKTSTSQSITLRESRTRDVQKFII